MVLSFTFVLYTEYKLLLVMYRKTYYVVVSVIVGLIVGTALFGLSNVNPEYNEFQEI